MRRRPDPHTRDLFAVPEPVAVGFGDEVTGRGSVASQIAKVVSRTLGDARDEEGLSRKQIAKLISGRLDRDISESKRGMDNPTDAQLNKIEAGIAKISQDTGQPKEELAALVAEAALAGTKNEDLLDVSTLASRFAIAAQMSPAQSGQKLAFAKNQFGLDTKGLAAFADSTNYVADKSATDEDTIMSFATGKVGPVAHGLKMNPQDLTAFGAVYGGLGIEPSMASTSMSTIMQRLQNAPNLRDKDMNKALRMLDTSPRQVQQNLIADPTATMMGLLEKLSALPQDRRAQALDGIAGLEHSSNLNALVNEVPSLKKALADARSPEKQGSVHPSMRSASTGRDRSPPRPFWNGARALIRPMSPRATSWSSIAAAAPGRPAPMSAWQPARRAATTRANSKWR